MYDIYIISLIIILTIVTIEIVQIDKNYNNIEGLDEEIPVQEFSPSIKKIIESIVPVYDNKILNPNNIKVTKNLIVGGKNIATQLNDINTNITNKYKALNTSIDNINRSVPGVVNSLNSQIDSFNKNVSTGNMNVNGNLITKGIVMIRPKGNNNKITYLPYSDNVNYIRGNTYLDGTVNARLLKATTAGFKGSAANFTMNLGLNPMKYWVNSFEYKQIFG